MRVIQNADELRAAAGSEIGVSDWLPVTQQLVDSFAALTLDSQWIHINAERAQRESPFGTTIAHGFLTLSLLSHLFRETFRFEGQQKMTINYGFNRVRFVSPVLSGGLVRLRAALQACRDIEGGLECTWDMKIETMNSIKPAVVAEWITRIYF
ncbi:MAG: MaoC family dehydratase [Bryobacteraceae bacterium]